MKGISASARMKQNPWLLLLLFGLFLPLRPAQAATETWAVYWYLCGSNLETQGGAASADLAELLRARLPDNVTVVIQTGGAKAWHSQGISPKHIGRYVYRNGRLEQVAQLPQASMGDEKTLASFLSFCKQNYRADHQVFVFWDHGGGSIGGLANDENYGFDALSLRELKRAFAQTYGASAKRPPFDIIGFDACLMATLDTASAMSGFARYMVASQEVEPANGWKYDGWLGALAGNTAMSAADLGKAMCDTYLQGCEEAGTAGKATLSLIDLAKIPLLNLTYNALGLEAVTAAMDDQNFYAAYGRQAKAAENYVNSRAEGYTNMVDIGSLVRRMEASLPEFGPSFLDSLREAIVYAVHGPYRSPSGLSCYYPFDGEQAGFNAMMQAGNITTFLVLNGLQLGFLDADSAVGHLERLADSISAALESDGVETGGHAPPVAENSPGFVVPPPSGFSPPQAENPVEEEPASPLASLQAGVSALMGSQDGASGQTPAGVAGLFAQAANSVVASVTPLPRLDISSLENFQVTVGDGGEARLDLGPERVKYLDSVQFYLACVSLEDNLVLLLGKDADMEANWNTGVFKDNFQGKWAALDGHLVYMEITNQDAQCYHYAVPVMLNGQRCNLVVVYDFTKGEYRVLGARQVHADGLQDKGLAPLQKGDKISTIFLAMSTEDENQEFKEVEVDSFTLGDTTTFEDTDLGDGRFMFMFEMTDVQHNSATSDVVYIEVKDGEALYGNI